MTTPKAAIPTVAPNSVQSVLSVCAMSVLLQLSHQIFENAPAMLEALELIEAGAGRGQQDRIARLRVGVGESHGRVERVRLFERQRTVKLFGDLGSRRAD